MIVCVLGMQRSGTSLVARLLNVLGVDLGPRDALIQAREDNPKGFWEHSGIQSLNEDILARLGGSWAHVPSVEPGWERDSKFQDLRERAQALIRRDFGSAEIWGWKDPTTSLTLPFWQEILPAIRYVICLRHPIDSARSLQQRDGLSLAEGVESWLLHVRSSFEHTANQEHTFVYYEHAIEDWHSTLRLLARFICAPERAERADVLEAAERFVDPGLHHYRISQRDLRQLPLSRTVLAATTRVYETLERDQHPDQHVALELLDEALQSIWPEAERQRRREHADWQSKSHKTSEEIGELDPRGETVILVDQNALLADLAIDRPLLPFLEREGQYWGTPADDTTAIQELERMRRAGAGIIVFAWPAFWWLEHYTAFHQYLRTHFRCPVENDRLVAFQLQS